MNNILQEEEVHCFNRTSVPKENETIFDDIDVSSNAWKQILNKTKYLRCYKREKEDCPFNRGNWILDFVDNENETFMCFKYPIQMSEIFIYRYLKPLFDLKDQIQSTIN